MRGTLEVALKAYLHPSYKHCTDETGFFLDLFCRLVFVGLGWVGLGWVGLG